MPVMEDNLKLFNSNSYLQEMELKDEEGIRLAKSIDSYIKSRQNNIRSILDIPCGLGRLSVELASKGYTVTGVDISDRFLKIANNRVNNVNLNHKCNFVKGNMYSESLKDMIKIEPDLILNWWTSIGYQDQRADQNFFQQLRELSHNGTIFMIETWNKTFILNHQINKTWKQLRSGIVLIDYNFLNFYSVLESNRTYYKFVDNSFSFIGEFKSRVVLYDLSDLAKMLNNADWQIIDVKNSIEIDTPFNPMHDGLLIIAKAI